VFSIVTPTLSVEDVFHTALDRYDESPTVYSAFLRRLAASDPRTFLKLAREAFLQRDLSRGLQVIGSRLASAPFLGSLLDLYAKSREEAISLAAKLRVCEPLLDLSLFFYAEQSRAAGLPVSKTLLPAIDILHAISRDARLVPKMLRLLRDADPAVRSKAALFVASRTNNLNGIGNRYPERDARVRANALEGLYQLRSGDVAQLFREAIRDPDNRVAANALFGLYSFGDTTSIPSIYDMASHSEAKFRASAAWLMGKTGDPRFIEVLKTLAERDVEAVRKHAVQSLRQVGTTVDAATRDGGSCLTVVKTHLQGDASFLSAIVRDPTGGAVQNIPGTAFILRVDSRVLREYTVEERSCTESVDVAFVCIQDAAQPAPFNDDLVAGAIRSCVPLRRPNDRWAVIRVSLTKTRAVTARRDYFQLSDAAPVQKTYEGALEFSSSQSQISRAIDLVPALVDHTREEVFVRVLESVLAAGRQSRQRHLILFGACDAAVLPGRPLRDEILRQGVRIHLIDSGSGAQQTEIKEATSLSGGSGVSAQRDSLVQACQAVYSSILHQYRVAWNGTLGKIELEVYPQRNDALFVKELFPAGDGSMPGKAEAVIC